MRVSVRDPLQPVVERAVELSRDSNSTQRDYASGRGVATHEDSFTQTDEDGNTIHDFILSVDTLGDLNAELRVEGRVLDYGN
jgi:capsule polysaccharide export protein KpsE/RkpR